MSSTNTIVKNVPSVYIPLASNCMAYIRKLSSDGKTYYELTDHQSLILATPGENMVFVETGWEVSDAVAAISQLHPASDPRLSNVDTEQQYGKKIPNIIRIRQHETYDGNNIDEAIALAIDMGTVRCGNNSYFLSEVDSRWNAEKQTYETFKSHFERLHEAGVYQRYCQTRDDNDYPVDTWHELVYNEKVAARRLKKWKEKKTAKSTGVVASPWITVPEFQRVTNELYTHVNKAIDYVSYPNGSNDRYYAVTALKHFLHFHALLFGAEAYLSVPSVVTLLKEWKKRGKLTREKFDDRQNSSGEWYRSFFNWLDKECRRRKYPPMLTEGQHPKLLVSSSVLNRFK